MSINKAILIGRLGRDPELRRVNNGNAVCSFSIATSEKYTDKNGQKQESTEWHNIVLWGKIAEISAQYLHKGSNVYLEGKITTRSWKIDGGETKYRTEIVANTMKMLDTRTNCNHENNNAQYQDSGQYQDNYENEELPF